MYEHLFFDVKSELQYIILIIVTVFGDAVQLL